MYRGEPRSTKDEIFDRVEDKRVKATEDGEEKEELRDSQLDRAIDIIKGIKAYKKINPVRESGG